MSYKDRKGSFRIALDNSDNGFSSWCDAVQVVMTQCIIVRAELDALSNTIEYRACSSHFDKVGAGEMIPGYLPILKADKNGNPEFVRFERL
jgi:hypothetical protein